MASDLARRLLIRDGSRVLLVNQPDDYASALGPLPEGASLTESTEEGEFDVIHLFVRNSGELEQHLGAALHAAAGDSKPALWISYPKTTSGVETDLTRDRGWEALRLAGWRPVTQVSVDEVWSALRFRPEEEVGQ